MKKNVGREKNVKFYIFDIYIQRVSYISSISYLTSQKRTQYKEINPKFDIINIDRLYFRAKKIKFYLNNILNITNEFEINIVRSSLQNNNINPKSINNRELRINKTL